MSSKKKKTTKKKASTGPVRLPTERSKPKQKLSSYSILLYGEKKVGKTTMCAEPEATLFVPFEPGTKALSVFEMKPEDWGHFKKIVNALCKDKKNRFKTVVIDTVSVAYKRCWEWVCKQHVIGHPSEEKWGKAWTDISDEFTKTFDKLIHSGKGVIFVAHSHTQRIETVDDEYDHISPALPKQANEYFSAIVDIWAYYGYRKGKRYLTINGDESVAAGQRIPGRFLTPKGKRLKRIYMGDNSKEAYSNFVKAFNNTYKPPKEVTKSKVKKTKKKSLKKKSKK